jgi:hypothetical protein
MPTRPFLAVGTAYQNKAAFHAEAMGRLILFSVSMSPDDSSGGGGGGGGGGGSNVFSADKSSSKASNVKRSAASSVASAAASNKATGHNYERTSKEPCVVMEVQFELDLNAPCSAICQVGWYTVVLRAGGWVDGQDGRGNGHRSLAWQHLFSTVNSNDGGGGDDDDNDDNHSHSHNTDNNNNRNNKNKQHRWATTWWWAWARRFACSGGTSASSSSAVSTTRASTPSRCARSRTRA